MSPRSERPRGGKAGRPPRLRLTARHKILLAVFGVGAAAVLVFGLELVLRISGYGPDLRAFKKVEIAGVPYWELNRDVSLRYFPPTMAKEPGFERFPVHKAPGTYRVFALGASSTAGDPYGPRAAYPAFLAEMLRDLHPERKIEVVNCGIIAISSTDVLDLLPEVLEHEPDAILVYTGHNEAYGADAVLSGIRGTVESRGLMRLRIRLRNSRIGMLVQNLSRRFVRPSGPPREFGMDLMEGKVLPREGPLHERMLEIYRGNLEEMIDRARRKGVDVILCTLVSNLRDQSPMGSAHGPGADEASWQPAFAAGTAAMAAGRVREAAGRLREATRADSAHAETRFRLARCLDPGRGGSVPDGAGKEAGGAGSTAGSAGLPGPEAAAAYRAARDEDTVHFRACSDENRIVREVATEKAGDDLLLVDLERDLTAVSPGGLPGREILTEHVHPVIRGHAFLADRICRALAASPMGRALGSWDLSRLGGASTYMDRLGLSAIDEATGLYVTARYKLGKWPFTQAYENRTALAWLEARIDSLSRRLDPVEAQVFAEIRSGRFLDGIDYGHRHQEIARRYMAAQQTGPAIREFRRCEAFWGPNAEITVNMAQAHLLAGDLAPTDSLLDAAGALDPDLARIRFVRGMLRRSQGRLLEARTELEAYLRLEPTGVFANAARQVLGQMGRTAAARR